MKKHKMLGTLKRGKLSFIAAYQIFPALLILIITPSISSAQSTGKFTLCDRLACTDYRDYPSAYAAIDKHYPLYQSKVTYTQNTWTAEFAVPTERPETITYSYGDESSEEAAIAVGVAHLKNILGDFSYKIEGSYAEDPNFLGTSSYGGLSFGYRNIIASNKEGGTATYAIEKRARYTCKEKYLQAAIGSPPTPDSLHFSKLCFSPYRPSIASKILQVSSCAANGQPCFPATGDKARFEKDLDFPAGAFVRNYHAMQQGFAPGMAPGWTHSYAQKLMVAGAGSFTAIDEKGNLEAYVTIESGVSAYSASFPGRVVTKTGSAYKMTDQGDLIKTFDLSGNLIAIESRETPQKNVTLSYDTLGRLSYLTDATGRQLLFNYTNDTEMGLLAGIGSSDGQAVTYEYNANRNLISAETTGYTRTYHYAESGLTTAQMPHHLTGISENNVRYATFAYDAKGRPISSTLHASGNDKADTTTIAYDDYYGSASVVRPSGEQRAYNYVGPQTTKMSYGLGTYQYFYSWSNGLGWLISSSDPRGAKTNMAYADGWTYPNVVTEAASTSQERRTTLRRDRSMQVVRSLVEGTQQTELGMQLKAVKRDESGRPLAYCSYDNSSSDDKYPCGSAANAPTNVRQTILTYCTAADAAASSAGCALEGLLKSTNGPRVDVSDITTFIYYTEDDAGCAQAGACGHRKGDLWKVTNALGHKIEYLSYDGAGRVLAVKDAIGSVTDFSYHQRGWLATSTARGVDTASDRTTRIDYWPTGLVKQVTQPDGAFAAFTYDTAHRLTDIADNAGNTLHYTLDNAGHQVKEDTKDASGALKRTLSRVYNQLGQLATQATAKGDPTDFGHDLNGNTNTVTDALGHKTQNDYDPLNRLARTLQDVGSIATETKFDYDAFDNLIKVTDPKGLETSYAYNGLGDLTKLTSPDTGVTTYTYDSAGNRATQTDARNIKTTYSYDALNRLTKVAYPTSSLNVSYTYDVSQTTCASGETYAIGRLARMQDGSGSTDYCYDRFGNLVRKVQTTNGKVFVLRYAYTKSGQLSRLTYPDGAVVDYVRNAQGQTTEVGVTPAGGSRQVLLGNASYYPFGPAAGWTYGNGRSLARRYDLDYRPQAIQDTRPGGLEVGFGFDPAGNLTALTPAGNPTPEIGLGYDALGRLTGLKDGRTGTLIDGYSFDATGNRLSAKVGTATQAYTYPADSHRLGAVAGVARTYDAAGNTTAIGGTARQYTYDTTGRMTQARRAGAVTMNYRYNGRGEQVRRFLGTTNTYTLYDEAGHWLGDYDSNGAAKQQAIWLDDLPVGLLANTNTLYYIEPDHLGSPRVVIDPTRDVAVWTWSLKGEAFGNTAPNQDPDGDGAAMVLDMRFPGQRFDAASGLNQNYFRDYEAATGRYGQSDPIGLIGGLSTYSYVEATPFTSVDATGLQGVRRLPQPGQGGFPGGYTNPNNPNNYGANGQPAYPPNPSAEQILGGILASPMVSSSQSPLGQLINTSIALAGTLCEDDDGDKCEKQAQADEQMCRMATIPGTAPRARCWESVQARWGACRSGNPLPPLVIW